MGCVGGRPTQENGNGNGASNKARGQRKKPKKKNEPILKNGEVGFRKRETERSRDDDYWERLSKQKRYKIEITEHAFQSAVPALLMKRGRSTPLETYSPGNNPSSADFSQVVVASQVSARDNRVGSLDSESMGSSLFNTTIHEHHVHDAAYLNEIMPEKMRHERFSFVKDNHFVNEIDDLFTIHCQLGETETCEVYATTLKKNGSKVALKVMPRSLKYNETKIRAQVPLLKSVLNNDLFVQFMGVYVDRHSFYIGLRPCYGGSLLRDLQTQIGGSIYDEMKAKRVIRTLLRGVAFLHDRKIVHRDINGLCLLYTHNSRELRLGGLGACMDISDEGLEVDDFVGNASYLAPEALRHRSGADLMACDLWACGIVTYLCLFGELPFKGEADRQILNSVLNDELDFPPPSESSVSATAKDFIHRLLDKNAESRMTVHQALDHEWLKDDVIDHSLILYSLASYKGTFKLKQQIAEFFYGKLSDDMDLIKEFLIIDTSSDDVLSSQEIESFLMSHCSMDPIQAKLNAFYLIQRISGPKASSISRDDWIMSQACTWLTKNRLRKKSFKQLDINSNRLITIGDLKVAFPAVAESILTEMIVEANLNEASLDVGIDFGEFETVLAFEPALVGFVLKEEWVKHVLNRWSRDLSPGEQIDERLTQFILRFTGFPIGKDVCFERDVQSSRELFKGTTLVLA